MQDTNGLVLLRESRRGAAFFTSSREEMHTGSHMDISKSHLKTLENLFQDEKTGKQENCNKRTDQYCCTSFSILE